MSDPLPRFMVSHPNGDRITMEFDAATNLLQLPGAVAFGLPMHSWTELGYTISPIHDEWAPLQTKPPTMTPAAVQFARNGKPIQAIKEVRDDSGCSLVDAKRLVDNYRKDHGL